MISDTSGVNNAFIVETNADEWTGTEPYMWRCWNCPAIGIETGPERTVVWYQPIRGAGAGGTRVLAGPMTAGEGPTTEDRAMLTLFCLPDKDQRWRLITVAWDQQAFSATIKIVPQIGVAYRISHLFPNEIAAGKFLLADLLVHGRSIFFGDDGQDRRVVPGTPLPLRLFSQPSTKRETERALHWPRATPGDEIEVQISRFEIRTKTKARK